MKLIGLTGGIACGKSLITAYLQSKNIPVVDADKIVHHLSKENGEIWIAYINLFGKSILNDDNTLNRALIGKIIFNDSEKLKKINEILHPIIKSHILSEVAFYKNKGNDIIILDIPLLYEARWDRDVDEVWVVKSSKKIQIERIINRDGLSIKDAIARIDAQMPLEEKILLADAIIDNSGDIKDTYRQIDDLLSKK